MVLLNSSSCNFDWQPNNFQFTDLKGKNSSFYESFGINGLLVMFICNHCPYVQAIIPRLLETTKSLKNIGISSIAIMPNNTKDYPEDSFDNMKKFSSSNNFNFPYLIDETQNISKSYGAVCTPDFFGYNKNGELNYRGRLSQMKGLKFVNSKNDLLDAMLMISKESKGPKEQYPSFGCSIKWY